MKVYVVSECCPVGCGSEVILLNPVSDESIFCYCYACGACWEKPEDAQFKTGLNYIKGPAEYSKSNVRLATQKEIEKQGLESFVTDVIDISDYHEDVVEVVNFEISKTWSSSAD